MEGKIKNNLNIEQPENRSFGVISLIDNIVFISTFVVTLTLITYLVLINVPAKYESSATVYVTQNTPTQTLDNSVLTVSTQFAGTFSQLGQTQSIIDQVSKKVHEKVDPSQIIITTGDNTQLVKVSVRDHSPQKAAEIANTLVDVLKRKISDLQSSINPENRAIIQISEKATPNEKAVSPRIPETLLGGIILWTILGYFLVYLTDYFDRTIKDEDDLVLVDQSLPIIGRIPLAKNKKRKRIAIESFRELRTNFSYANENKKLKLIAISSTNDGEGKTYTGLEFSQCLANSGKKVLLIDFDLRRLGLSRRLIMKSRVKNGSADAILSSLTMDKVEVKKISENLDVLPVGGVPHNPGEIFASKEAEHFFDLLKKDHHYDFVIMDTPPIGHVNDAVLISAKVDGVIVVVGINQTGIDELKSTIYSLNNVKANILGVVLNRAKDKRNRSYGIY